MCLLYWTVFLIAGIAKNVFSKDIVQIGSHIQLPSSYDIQALPSIPVHVNVSVFLYEIISIDEPKQVTIKAVLNFVKITDR